MLQERASRRPLGTRKHGEDRSAQLPSCDGWHRHRLEYASSHALHGGVARGNRARSELRGWLEIAPFFDFTQVRSRLIFGTIRAFEGLVF